MGIYTGKHDLIVHDFTAGARSAQGKSDRVRIEPSGISLADAGGGYRREGCYTSAPVSLPFQANEMILTWNGTSPEGAALDFEFRVRGGLRFSNWFQMGAWKPENKKKLFQNDTVYGPLNVDHLKATRWFNSVQYRVFLRSHGGSQTPVLRRISFCISDTRGCEGGKLPASVPVTDSATDLDVPCLSQHNPETVGNDEMIRCGVCAATSVTMVLNYYGIPVKVSDVAGRAFDPNAKIYGNWAFLIAAASEFGTDSWVQRFNSWDGIVEYIAGGTPVIISISYKKGELRLKPDRESAGHLIVVRGITSEGDLICNDPDELEPFNCRPVIYCCDELSRAFFSHGGVALIIKK